MAASLVMGGVAIYYYRLFIDEERKRLVAVDAAIKAQKEARSHGCEVKRALRLAAQLVGRLCVGWRAEAWDHYMAIRIRGDIEAISVEGTVLVISLSAPEEWVDGQWVGDSQYREVRMDVSVSGVDISDSPEFRFVNHIVGETMVLSPKKETP